MEINSNLIAFMRVCLDNKEIFLSWQGSNIELTRNQLTFDVYGFNYRGKIVISSEGEGFKLFANQLCIAEVVMPIDALNVLDNYIEYNESEYLRIEEIIKKI